MAVQPDADHQVFRDWKEGCQLMFDLCGMKKFVVNGGLMEPSRFGYIAKTHCTSAASPKKALQDRMFISQLLVSISKWQERQAGAQRRPDGAFCRLAMFSPLGEDRRVGRDQLAEPKQDLLG